MKKLLLTLIMTLSVCMAVFANSLCGGGLKYTFSGGDTGTVVLYTPNGDTLSGNYLVDHKNNIRIVWDTGYSEKLIYVRDGVFTIGNITLRTCR